jgi:hypothetical protein
MKKKNVLFFSVMIAVGVLTAWSCKKDDDKTVTKEEAIAVAKNDVISDAVYDNIYNESEDVMSNLEKNKYPSNSKKSAALSGTRNITVTKSAGDSATFPKEIVVIYSDYISNSGVKISGTVRITQSDKIRKANAVRTITLDGFKVNDSILVEGKKTITNLGLVNGKPSIKIELTNGKITYNNGNYITRNFTRTITWNDGFLTPFNIWDDVYTITTTGDGSSKSGYGFSAKTTEALEYKVGEFCIKKGKLEINVENKTVYVDYNRTDCLSKIKLIIEGSTEEYRIF